MTGGGVTFVAPPPSQGTAGWYAAGGPNPTASTVQRMIFATDTETATVRGPLNGSNYRLTGVGNFNYGWYAGGFNGNTLAVYSTVERITYATDTATATVRGSLASSTYWAASTGNTTDGWVGGGQVWASPPLSTVQRITYATDTTTATTKGPLSSQRGTLASTTDGTTYSWYAGGASATTLSTIDRITYATDTATASIRGPLSGQRQFMASTSISAYGYFIGGNPSSNSTVDRITYATDTDTASVRGPLSSGRTQASGMGDNSYGWIAGGATVMQRITYATDTAASEARGSLSLSRSNGATTSGIQ